MHLIVSHHGMWGVPEHLTHLIDTIKKVNVSEIHILNSNMNLELATYDGIDACGDRHVQLIEETVKSLEQTGKTVDKVSFIGYSLGGLINRFAIGKLYYSGFFKNRIPHNFFTIVTPHLGVQKSPNLFGLFWNSSVSFFTLRTGKQIALKDTDYIWNNSSHVPLLVAMCDPKGPFYIALSKFKHRELYANIRNDFSSRFTTSAIENSNQFAKHRAVEPDPLNLPYIVKLDKESPKEKEVWSIRSITFFSLFVVLSPIAIPALLGILSIRLWKLKTERLQALAKLEISHEWIVSFFNSHVEDNELVTELEEEAEKNLQERVIKVDSKKSLPLTSYVKCVVPNEIPNLKNQRETRKWMIDSLNSLGWEKCFIRIENTNAHAAIIARRPESHQIYFHLVDFIVARFFGTF